MVELFSPEQLGLLFDKEKLIWLDASITESGDMGGLHTYLVGRKSRWSKDWEIKPLFEGLQIDVETLAPKLTAEFLGNQPISWLLEFIQYITNGTSALKRTPFIRLTSGEQVSLPDYAEMSRPAWFTPNTTMELDLSMFPVVHPELIANSFIRKFLEKEGIREIDAAAIVEKCILPKYQGANTPFDDTLYRSDLQQISEAFRKAGKCKRNSRELFRGM